MPYPSKQKEINSKKKIFFCFNSLSLNLNLFTYKLTLDMVGGNVNLYSNAEILHKNGIFS